MERAGYISGNVEDLSEIAWGNVWHRWEEEGNRYFRGNSVVKIEEFGCVIFVKLVFISVVAICGR